MLPVSPAETCNAYILSREERESWGSYPSPTPVTGHWLLLGDVTSLVTVASSAGRRRKPRGKQTQRRAFAGGACMHGNGKAQGDGESPKASAMCM